MNESFFEHLEEGALRQLLARSSLQDAALVTVGPSLHIENCNDTARQLIRLRPLERIDQLLDEAAAAALRGCIADRQARTVYEELDGVRYRLEMVPHREGALIAFVREDHAAYDGSLRVLHAKSVQYLGALLADAEQVDDPALAAHLRRQCLRLYRLLTHSDFLHDPPLTEQLRLHHVDLAVICRDAVQAALENGPQRGTKTITFAACAPCEALVEPQLIRTALYNLLSNAQRVTPVDGDISVALHDDGAFFTISVADRGPGLDADTFESLLTGWQRTVSLEDYLTLARQGAPLGLGLPLAQRIAQLHGGSLLLSPREGGGSTLHFSLAHLPDSLADHNLCTPMILEDGYTLEEVEFSVFE
nr:sensor histidine kinase [uncultured Agathobaculum sp.]